MIQYRKKYIQTYIWQALSILLGFASLFVVVPYLSSDKTLYGIYSVCTSLTIFFSYADLGVLSAGVKYAAEYYIKGDHRNEMRVIGFTAFVMISVFSILALGIAFIGVFPKILIPELVDDTESFKIARYLLFTLAIACPIIIGQRILGLIFTIRVEDYKFQRMLIIGSLARIASVLYFFHGGHYRVVEFYAFYQLVNLIVVLVALIYSKKYGYKLKDFISAFRFDKEIFNKVKKLSGTSLILVVSMILYYELDQVVISNFWGIEAVAIYGAALSVLTLVRTFCSLVYSPYASRYNHFVGLNDYQGLSRFVNKMIIMFAPVIIVPIIVLAIFAKTFVISWIGLQYVQSAMLVSFLVLSFLPNFIKDPITNYFIATEQNSVLIKYNVILPVIYWLGIVVTSKMWGLESFAVFKFVAPTVTTVGYLTLIGKDYAKRGLTFVGYKPILKTIFSSIFVAVCFAFALMSFTRDKHDKLSLLFNILVMGVCVILALASCVPFNSVLKQEAINYIRKFKKRL